MARRVMVLVAYLGLGCSGGDGGDGGPDEGATTLGSDPHECGIVAKVSGGLEHAFGGALDCAGATDGTTLYDYQGQKGDAEAGYVALQFAFLDPPPAEGQAGPVTMGRVSLGHRLPGPDGDFELGPIDHWVFPEGGCSMTVNSTSRDPDLSGFLWFNAEGTCTEPAVATGTTTKSPLSLPGFAFNSYVLLLGGM